MPFIIDDNTDNDLLYPQHSARGLVERDWTITPEGLFSPPSEIPNMELTEIADRIKDHETHQSSLWHYRRRGNKGSYIPSLDQNGQGFCWSYSVTGTVMMARALAGLPLVRLSAHAVACKVKNFVDQGGWCGLSAEYIRKNGVPSVEFWKEKSMSRQYDTAATWENAKGHIITEDYVDLTRRVYDQNLTKKQTLICLVLNYPVAGDFNWWGHSVLLLQALCVKNSSQNLTLDDFQIRGLNSWTDNWGDLGEFTLQGQKSIPNGAVATRAVVPSVK